MDTRIGYPNEHLGKGLDEVKSPMYATGVGLVISGLKDAEYLAKKNKHELGEVKPEPIGDSVGGSKAPSIFGGRWLEFIKKSLVDDGGDSNLNG
jgi:cell division protein FtsA